jgi:hypothetical protein
VEYDFSQTLHTGPDLTLSWKVNPSSLSAQVCVKRETWISVGVSSAGSMAPSDVVLGQMSKSSDLQVQKYKISSRNSGGVVRLSDDLQDLTETSLTQIDGVTCMDYTIPLESTSTHDVKTTGDTVFIYAFGNAGSNTLAYHNNNRGSMAIDLNKGDGSVITNDSRKIFIVHGVIMTLAWAVLIPLGIFMARFGKQRFDKGKWFKVHRATVASASLMTLVAFALAFKQVQDGEGGYTNGDRHTFLGLFVVFGGAVVMPVLGAVRPHATEPGEEKETKRFVWELVHKNLGKIVGLVAVLNLMMGWSMVSEEDLSKVIIAVLVILALSFVGLEASGFSSDRTVSNGDDPADDVALQMRDSHSKSAAADAR